MDANKQNLSGTVGYLKSGSTQLTVISGPFQGLPTLSKGQFIDAQSFGNPLDKRSDSKLLLDVQVEKLNESSTSNGFNNTTKYQQMNVDGKTVRIVAADLFAKDDQDGSMLQTSGMNQQNINKSRLKMNMQTLNNAALAGTSTYSIKDRILNRNMRAANKGAKDSTRKNLSLNVSKSPMKTKLQQSPSGSRLTNVTNMWKQQFGGRNQSIAINPSYNSDASNQIQSTEKKKNKYKSAVKGREGAAKNKKNINGSMVSSSSCDSMMEDNKILKQRLSQLEKYAPKKLFKQVETPAKSALQSIITSQSEMGAPSTQRDVVSATGKSELSKFNRQQTGAKRMSTIKENLNVPQAAAHRMQTIKEINNYKVDVHGSPYRIQRHQIIHNFGEFLVQNQRKTNAEMNITVDRFTNSDLNSSGGAFFPDHQQQQQRTNQRRSSIGSIVSKQLLPQIKIRGMNQDLPNQQQIQHPSPLQPKSKRFKSIEPNQRRYSTNMNNSNKMTQMMGSGLTYGTSNVNQLRQHNNTIQQIWNFDQEKVYDSDYNRMRKNAYIDDHQRKMKMKIQRSQQTKVQINQQIEQDQLNRMGQTFQDRIRVQKLNEMRNQLIQNAKLVQSNQMTTPIKIEEEHDSKDDHLSNNLGNVANVIAKNIEMQQQLAMLNDDKSVSIDEVGVQNQSVESTSRSRRDKVTLTEQQSLRQTGSTFNKHKKRVKKFSSTISKMNQTGQRGGPDRSGQGFIRIQDETKSKATARRSGHSTGEKQSTIENENIARATASKFRDKKLKQHLRELMQVAESQTPTYRQLVENDFEQISLKLRRNLKNQDRDVRQMSIMSRSPRKHASQNSSPMQSTRSPERRMKEPFLATYHSLNTSQGSLFGIDMVNNQRRNMDYIEQQSYYFQKMHPEFKTGLTPSDTFAKSYSFVKNKYRSIHKMMKKADPPQVLTNQEMKMINERQRRYNELKAVSESSHFERSFIDQSNREESELPDDYIFKNHSKSNLLESYRKKLEPKKVKIKRDTVLSDSENDQYTLVPPSPIHVFAPPLKGAPSDQETPSATSQVKRTLQESKAARQSKRDLHQKNLNRAMNQYFDYVQMEQIFDNVQNLNKELDQKMLEQKFKDHANIKNNQGLKQFTEYVQNQNNFRELCKNGKSPYAIETKDKDPSYQYFKITDEKHQPAINIFDKIENKALHLLGYNLNEALCQAFELSCKLKPDCINEILLDNNGLKDSTMGTILAGLNHLEIVKKIVIKNQMDFQQQSIDYLSNLCHRKPSKNVEELRLNNLRLTARQSQNILYNMLYIKEKLQNKQDDDQVNGQESPENFREIKIQCYIQKLSIVKCNLDSTSVTYLIQLIKENKLLSDLDISFNDLKIKEIAQLSEELATNQRLKYLNLSWNEAISKSPNSKMRVPNFNGNDLESGNMTPVESKIIENLCQFIKKNTVLLHLDLSNMGIHSEMIKEFGPALRKSKSILSLHLSGNPGVTKDVKKYLRQRVRCVPKVKANHIDGIDKDVTAALQNSNSPLKHSLSKEGTFKAGQQLKMFTKDLHRQDDGRIEIQGHTGNHLVLQRIMGHKHDIPGSGQWNLFQNSSDKCWVCHHHVYSLIFWSEEIGHNNSDNALSAVLSDDIIIQKTRSLHQKTTFFRSCVEKEISQTEQYIQQVQEEMQQNRDQIDALRPEEEMQTEISEYGQKIFKEKKLLPQLEDRLAKAYKQGNEAKQQDAEAELKKVKARIKKIKDDGKDLLEEKKLRKKLNKEYETLDKELNVLQKKFDKFDTKMNNWTHVSQYDAALGEEGSSPGVPVIQGPFTNWHPKKMMSIEEFCQNVDSQIDFIEKMKRDDLCRPSVLTPDELNEQERIVYNQYEEEYHELYRNTWQDIIKDEFEERRINFVNFEFIKHLYDKNNSKQSREVSESDGASELLKSKRLQSRPKLFVYPCILRPGPLTYMIRLDPPSVKLTQKGQFKIGGSLLLSRQQSATYDDQASAILSIISQDSEFFVHNHIAPFRTEEIPNYVKSFNTVQTVRNFDKNNSVFREWREDTFEKLDQSTKHDMENWKGEKFIKQNIEEVKDIVRRYIVLFKQVQTYYAGSSAHFPYISVPEFWIFIERLNLTSKKQFIQPSLTAATQIDKQHPNFAATMKDNLLRFQFIEVIVRVADGLYRDNFATVPERFEHFMQQDFLPKTQNIVEEWSDFRMKELWTKEVNKIFEINKTSIMELMRHHYPNKKQQYLSMDNVVTILTTDNILSEREAKHVYAMGKMPSSNDTREIANMQKILNSAEFMEIIGRAADVKYKDDESLRLAEKIEKIMHPLFKIIGAPVISPLGVADVNEESQSDEDY